MADGQDDGPTDLERELTCSICTDVLYQPLTLLDCLHTFCGSCLREWFAWQASRATTPSPYTCPSCRAPVRETRPNATVTTLLEVLLKAHPSRAKPAGDREEIAKSYKPGDNVIPTVSLESDSEDSEDRRVLEEARQLSLQEVDPERARRRAERTSHHARVRRRQEREARAAGQHTPTELGRAQQHSRFIAQSRPLEHQSSLRSMLSASDVDSDDMQEELRRQIIDEGLLDDVDLNNMTREQEEEITERIALAFQRRQHERSPHPHSRRRPSRSPRMSDSTERSTGSRRTSRSADRQRGHDRPPLSRPHLLGVATESDRRRHARSSSQSSQQSNRSGRLADGARPNPAQPASRSVTDLSSTSGSEARDAPRQAARATRTRTSTDPEGHAVARRSRRVSNDSHEMSNAARPANVTTAARQSESPAQSQERPPSHRQRQTPVQSSTWSSAPQPRHLRHTPASDPTSVKSDIAGPNPRSTPDLPIVASPPPMPQPAPSITCSRCQHADIQYDLHYNCSTCNGGQFNLCMSCYRAGKGCQYWFGFGYAAAIRFNRSELPINAEQPHVLSARRYQDHRTDSPHRSHQLRYQSNQPPLDEGLFCESCFNPTNSCYWHCETCLDGAWGFCQPCVQRGLNCTHPLEAMSLGSLLPPANASWPDGSHPSRSEITTPPLSSAPDLSNIVSTPSLLSNRTKRLPHVPEPGRFAPLLLPCECDICHRSIPSSAPRYHCPVCPDGQGDYDVCTSCYNSLVSSGKISQSDGPQGWRRCFKGHRMVVIGFEERDRGLRRVVLRDLVGGLALKEEEVTRANSTPQNGDAARWRWKESDGTLQHAGPNHARPGGVINVQDDPSLSSPDRHNHSRSKSNTGAGLLPPDGGVGLRVQALWSYFPAEGVVDELPFPRGAEIREAENINEDWFWGVYTGRKGLFPGNYGRVVGY